MPYDDAAKNAMLPTLTALALRVALHTGDPGAGSANELSGGGYARQAATWAAPAAGVASLSNVPRFSVPAVTITWVSVWNAAGSVRYGKVAITPAVFGTPGTFDLTAGNLELNT